MSSFAFGDLIAGADLVLVCLLHLAFSGSNQARIRGPGGIDMQPIPHLNGVWVWGSDSPGSNPSFVTHQHFLIIKMKIKIDISQEKKNFNDTGQAMNMFYLASANKATVVQVLSDERSSLIS